MRTQIGTFPISVAGEVVPLSAGEGERGHGFPQAIRGTLLETTEIRVPSPADTGTDRAQPNAIFEALAAPNAPWPKEEPEPGAWTKPPTGTDLTLRAPVSIARGSSITVRSRFLDFTRRNVLHCHMMNHEERGMMQVAEMIDPA